MATTEIVAQTTNGQCKLVVHSTLLTLVFLHRSSDFILQPKHSQGQKVTGNAGIQQG